MELKDLLKSLAELDEMEASDGMNLAEAEEKDLEDLANKDEMESEDGMNIIEDLNESSKNRVKVNVFYDGEKIDELEFSHDLPDGYDKAKITTEIEVI